MYAIGEVLKHVFSEMCTLDKMYLLMHSLKRIKVEVS